MNKEKIINKEHNSRLPILVFILAFLTYSNTLNHNYVFDDRIVITENKRVQKGIAGIPDLFYKYNSDKLSDKYGYRPIVLSSFAIDYQFFGLNSKAGHFMNLFYFAILCLVLFKILQKIFYEYSVLPSLLITLIFIVHPIHVEVVANIKSRDEIFALLFSLISLSYFIKYNKEGKFIYLIASLLIFFLAFLSKESAITFLVIMPLTVWYMNKWKGSASLLKSSMVLIVAIFICLGIVNFYISSQLGISKTKDPTVFYENILLGNSFLYTGDFTQKVANASTIFALYLKNFFFPINLVYYYGYNQIPVASWNQFIVIFSFLIHLIVLVYSIFTLKKNKEISYGLFFYLITISFYSHIIKPLADTMADRFLFTPSLGLIILCVFTIAKLLKIDFKIDWFERIRTNKTTYYKWFTSKSGLAFIILLLLLSIKTYSRNKAWKDDLTLSSTDMSQLENCSRAHFYYANLHQTSLKNSFNSDVEKQMIHHYKRSYEITDSAFYSYYYLALYYFSNNRFKEGIPVLKQASDNYPKQSVFKYYLGLSYIKNNELVKGIKQLKTSIDLAPNVSSIYYSMALACSEADSFDLAINTLSKMKTYCNESNMLYEALSKVYFDKVIYDSRKKVSAQSISKVQYNLTQDQKDEIEKSKEYGLKSLDFAANPKFVYENIIIRYQTIGDKINAFKYYNIAVSKDILKKQ